MEKKDYRDALVVQDGCNLCGIVQSFAKVLLRLVDESRARDKSTDWVNRHPISKLYASKIEDLSRSQTGLVDALQIAESCAKLGEPKDLFDYEAYKISLGECPDPASVIPQRKAD